MNIDIVKQILADRYSFVVLDDMSGPVGLNAGRVIESKSRTVPDDESDEWIAEQLNKSIDGDRKFFAFYKTVKVDPMDNNTIFRYALFSE